MRGHDVASKVAYSPACGRKEIIILRNVIQVVFLIFNHVERIWHRPTLTLSPSLRVCMCAFERECVCVCVCVKLKGLGG